MRPPALRPQTHNLEWTTGIEPASARRQRTALAIELHPRGRRDGIRTRAGQLPDRFAGGRLRLLGHSATAPGVGLEPTSTRLTAERLASQPPRKGSATRDAPRCGRARTAGGSRTRDLLVEGQACCRSTTTARLECGVGCAAGTARTCALPLRRRPLCPLSYDGWSGRLVPPARVERAPGRLEDGCSLR